MEEERKIVKDFTEAMLKKIEKRHNRYSPLGWKTMDIKRIVWLLKGELDEFQEAYDDASRNSMRDEAVDIANYAMFLWYISKRRTL